MGQSCCRSETANTKMFNSIMYRDVRTLKVQITTTNAYRPRKVVCKVKLPKPDMHQIETVATFGNQFQVSMCVLPGFDLFGNIEKECQDTLLFSATDSGLLAGVFDGHGSEGRLVSQRAMQFCKTHFQFSCEKFLESPQESLVNMINICEEYLNNSNIKEQCIYAGSTACIVYICKKGLYTVNLGDSRAIMSSRPITNFEKMMSNEEIIRDEIVVSQLTRDHKPEDEDEHKRVIEAGGRVGRLQDAYGNEIGPYRVCSNENNNPGIAVSRSLGDNLAKTYGVCAIPDYKEFKVNHSQDYFIVVGSDGVWDVLNCKDTAVFIELYRQHAAKRITEPQPRQITVSHNQSQNTTIAHLLAEEARNRWLNKIESSYRIIDDIGVIVIEIGNGPLTGFLSNTATPMQRSLLETEAMGTEVTARIDQLIFYSQGYLPLGILNLYVESNEA